LQKNSSAVRARRSFQVTRLANNPVFLLGQDVVWERLGGAAILFGDHYFGGFDDGFYCVPDFYV